MGKRWLPLESNPYTLSDFARKLGFNTSTWNFCDVYGLDEELLQMVPQPVIALLLLFPVTSASEEARQREDRQLREKGYNPDPNVYFMKQTISNACGTIGALHAIGNNLDVSMLDPGSFLQSFFSETAGMDADQRGRYLEQPPEGAPDIDAAHEAAAKEGDTAPPSLDEVVNLHFVALVHRGGRLLELDGRKSFPIDHGPTTPDMLLQDAAKVARKFMDTVDSLNFNLIALAKPAPA